MTMTSPSNRKMLSSWDASKQQAYRSQHQALTFHILLDESPSMIGQEALALRQAFNMYLEWLKRHADAMSLVEVRCFSTLLSPGKPEALGSMKPLTGQTYNPANGNGTALYRAVGEVATTATPDGQHILIVFTDGGDNTSEELGWDHGRVFMILKTLQEQSGWLCVFLGAFPESLDVGKQMGFAPGNCLTFASDKIPEAFNCLQVATQKYLTAGQAERKLLAAGGVF